jgi:hypothetical protein
MITMRVRTAILVSTMLALPLGSTADAQASDSPIPQIEVGKPFPGLFFPSLEDGKLTSMSAFLGKKTIVHVFASW